MHFRLRDGMFLNEEEAQKAAEPVKTDDDDEFEYSITRRSKTQQNVRGKKLDQKMYQFYVDRMKQSAANAQTLAMQNDFIVFDTENPEIEYDEEEYKEYGFVESVKFRGTRLSAICPYCHNKLVSGAGKKKMLLISVVGDTNAGKTVYFSALQKLIGGKLMYLGEDDADDYNFFKTGTTLPKATNTKPLPSCTMLYTPDTPSDKIKPENVILIFCDIAGENTRTSDNLERTAFNLPNSSALLFMVDPTRFRQTMGVIDGTAVDDNNQRNVFTALYNFFHAGNKVLKTPTAIVITKSDILKDHPYFSNSSDNLALLASNTPEQEKAYVDLAQIDKVDNIARDFLNSVGEEVYITSTKNVFENSKFFMVSSLGYNPDVEGNDGVIKPSRVMEPFDWLMYENGAAYARHKESFTYEINGFVLPVLNVRIGYTDKRLADIDFYYKCDEDLEQRIEDERNKAMGKNKPT